MENKNNYENLIVHFWDILKVSNLLMNNIPFEQLSFDKTDILLESILRNEYILFKRILKKGFNVNESKFNYLIPILNNYEDYKIKYVDCLFEYVNPQEYINRKGSINKENSLSVVCQQKNQNIILYLSDLGGDWNSQNNLGQTPFHFLIRNHFEISDELLLSLENKKIDLEIKDIFDINAKKILNSFLLTEEWKTDKNLKLLKAIKYEDR
jgi:hypothetical protein